MNNLELAPAKYHFYDSFNERFMFRSETKIMEKIPLCDSRGRPSKLHCCKFNIAKSHVDFWSTLCCKIMHQSVHEFWVLSFENSQDNISNSSQNVSKPFKRTEIFTIFWDTQCNVWREIFLHMRCWRMQQSFEALKKHHQASSQGEALKQLCVSLELGVKSGVDALITQGKVEELLRPS